MTDAGLWTASLTALLIFAPLMAGLLLYLVTNPILLEKLPVALAGALLACLVALSIEFAQTGPFALAMGGHDAPIGIELRLDALALAMLWLTAVVALAVNVYSVGALPASGGEAAATGFRLLWLPLWSALNALFLTADVFTFYVLLELVSLTAISLVTLDGGARAIGAASRYLLFALAGSTFYLLGVAVLYADTGLLALELLEASPPAGPAASLAAACMTLGLAMKAALFPAHGWLPHAHAEAPSSASAILSALVVTGGAYLIIRLWFGPFGPLTQAPAGQILAALGAAGMVYGSLQALRQSRLKLLVAYSTVAQLGYLLLALPLASALAIQGAALHAVAHGLAKAAFFLAAGNVLYLTGSDRLEELGRGDRRLAGPLAVMAVAGASLAGLPPTGGFMAKWTLASAALAAGQWWWAIMLVVGSLLATAYIVRVLQYGLRPGDNPATGRFAGTSLPWAMRWPPLLLAAAAAVMGTAVSMLAPWLPGDAAASLAP